VEVDNLNTEGARNDVERGAREIQVGKGATVDMHTTYEIRHCNLHDPVFTVRELKCDNYGCVT
jgi:hypothetical protein